MLSSFSDKTCDDKDHVTTTISLKTSAPFNMLSVVLTFIKEVSDPPYVSSVFYYQVGSVPFQIKSRVHKKLPPFLVKSIAIFCNI